MPTCDRGTRFNQSCSTVLPQAGAVAYWFTQLVLLSLATVTMPERPQLNFPVCHSIFVNLKTRPVSQVFGVKSELLLISQTEDRRGASAGPEDPKMCAVTHRRLFIGMISACSPELCFHNNLIYVRNNKCSVNVGYQITQCLKVLLPCGNTKTLKWFAQNK